MLSQQLVQNPDEFAESWNFGPNEEDALPVCELADIMIKCWGEQAAWGLNEGAHSHEARFLKLDCSKAKTKLKWKPIWNLERAIDETVRWYKEWHNKNKKLRNFTLNQIEIYQQEHIAQ